MDAALGIDLGSTTCKAVLLGKDGKILGRGMTETRADYRFSADMAEKAALLGTAPGLRIVARMGTGYGRALLPFPERETRSEILCHGKGARHLFADARTVLDIGGQDTKAIQLDENGFVSSFFMNDRCAAGCGRYLGYVAEELELGLSDLGPLACQACRCVPVTSTCTVFAGTEVRSLLSAGEKREEVLLGLHRAVVLRALSLLARSGGIFDALVFTGGVAQNQAVVKLLREYLVKNHPGLGLHIHPDAIYTGALGAALYALEVS